jgi:hypothetical protein
MNVKQISQFIFPSANRDRVTIHVSLMKRELRADHLLVENIRTLLSERGIDDSALAIWCGHKPAWISKIMSLERGVPMKELGKIADFFGLTVSQLFSTGISSLTERRKCERRSAIDRRTGIDRRQPIEKRLSVHPDVNPFPPRPKRKALPDASVMLRLKSGDVMEPI